MVMTEIERSDGRTETKRVLPNRESKNLPNGWTA
jgi:hypothetical protein